MKTQPKLNTHVTLLHLAALLALATGTLGAATTESNLEKTFVVKPGGQFTLEADRGPIEVATSDRGDIVVEVKRTVTRVSAEKAAEIFAAHVVTFDQDGDRVEVRGKVKEGFSKLFNRGLANFEVKYRVLAPKKFNFDLKTAAGSIRAEDIDGKIRARTSGGSLRFEAVSGNFDGSTAAGDIRAGVLGGKVSAKTSGGSVSIDQLQAGGNVETSAGSITINQVKGELSGHTSGGSIHLGETEAAVKVSTAAGSIHVKSAKGPLVASTSGGSITIEDAQDTVNADTSAGSITATFSSQPKSDCRLTTSGGGITITLDPELAFDVEAKTSGGRVSTEIPIATTVLGNPIAASVKGKLNGGGKALVLRTSAGNVTIRKK